MINSVSPITIGTDAEVFVKDLSTGEIQASQGVVKGSKTKPFKTKHGFVQRDNVLAEVNTKPAKTETAFIKGVKGVLGDLSSILEEHGKIIDISSSHIMDLKYLDHFEASRFYCSRTFNCWDLDEIIKPSVAAAGQLRTASGDIHIGLDFTSMEDQLLLARMCEIHIGLPSIAWDKDSRRRSIYGRAGTFRPKEYGIEYKVPSNFWLANTGRMGWMFRAAKTSAMYYHTINIPESLIPDIIDTINNCNAGRARELCDHFGVPWGDMGI